MTRLVAIVFFFLIPTLVRAELDQELVVEKIRDFYTNTSLQPAEADIAKHKNTVFVLVKGFGGEDFPISQFYFGPLRKELERLTNSRGQKDPAKKRVFLVDGDSKEGIAVNAEKLEKKVADIVAKADPKSKIFFISHSKGALETWTMLMKNPAFAEEKVAGALLLQGPFQGTPLADFVMEKRKVSDIQPFSENWLQYILRTLILARGAPPAYHKAIGDLTTTKATAHVAEIEKLHGPNQSSHVWDRSLFLWTKHEPLKGLARIFPVNNPFMDICHRALTKISGSDSNDGFVMTPNSALPASIAARAQVISGFHHSAFDVGQAGTALGKAIFSSAP